MEEKFDILDKLKKTVKPALPEDYFDEFYSKLEFEEAVNNQKIDLDKKAKPEIPTGFFTNFSGDLMTKIKEETEQKEPTRVWPFKLVGFVSAVAACALIFFMLQPSDEEATLADTSINSDTKLEEESVDSYLAYLDEDEIVDFLIENEDIEISEELTENEEDEYYFLEEDLEEYYLEDL